MFFVRTLIFSVDNFNRYVLLIKACEVFSGRNRKENYNKIVTLFVAH